MEEKEREDMEGERMRGEGMKGDREARAPWGLPGRAKLGWGPLPLLLCGKDRGPPAADVFPGTLQSC